MLKAVSSITNAIGALNFKGTWDANANSPALASSVGTKGDYYVVGTAGSTNLNGISNWGVGDLATFNGSVWQRVEGGADLNGVNLSVSGTSTLSGLTASTALALNASKEVVSVTNTGSGNNVLATTPSFASTLGVGGATAAASGAGVSFPATQSASSDANTLDDYEEGTFDVAITPASGSVVMSNVRLQYTKVGRQVTVTGECNITSVSTPSGAVTIGNLPFVNSGNAQRSSRTGFFIRASSFTGAPLGVCTGFINVNVSVIDVSAVNNFVFADIGANLQAGTAFMFSFSYMTTT
jgi:hypothetical protein